MGKLWKKCLNDNYLFIFADGLSRQSSSATTIMTPNVSDFDEKTTITQASPPKPVSTVLQHNYSNIHQPIPRQTTSLTSSRTQSSNTSPVLTNSPPCGGVVATFSSEGGAFTKLTQRTATPPDKKPEEFGKSKLAEINDLIHLEVNGGVSNLNEDLIIRTLQSRFFNQKHFVSILN